jgi:CheY-like chemotaxis protein
LGATETISLAGVRVLVVEDVAINQLIATHALEKLGATVTIASDGAKAIDTMRRSPPETPFDVVLMDLQMPVLDGFEATKRLREDLRFHDVPIVAMTAHALDEERERCLSVGMDDHLGKPFDPAKLAATVATSARVGNERKSATKPTPPLEADRGIAQLGGNVDGYRRALGAFVAGASTTLAPLDEALEAADLDEARAELAALRGAASTLGAPLLRRAIDELEEAIEADAAPRRRARDMLAASLRATCEAATRWLAS